MLQLYECYGFEENILKHDNEVYTFKLSQWRNFPAKGSVSFNSKFFLNVMEESFQKVFKISFMVSRKLEKSNKNITRYDLKINNRSNVDNAYIFKTGNSKYCLSFKLRNPSKKKKRRKIVRKLFQNLNSIRFHHRMNQQNLIQRY